MVVVLDVLVLVDDDTELVDDDVVLVDGEATLVVEAIVDGTEVVDGVVTSAVTDRSGAGTR